jgi:serine/threonine protein phosphatase PrpC
MVRENFKGASYNGCFAVFDGHGGQRAAEFARMRLGHMLDAHHEIETTVMGSIK